MFKTVSLNSPLFITINRGEFSLNKVIRLLGEEAVESVLKTGRRKVRPVRDLSIYALNRMSVYTNKEIGEVFGVGYTAVTESIKRAERYLEKNKRTAKLVRNIIDN